MEAGQVGQLNPNTTQHPASPPDLKSRIIPTEALSPLVLLATTKVHNSIKSTTASSWNTYDRLPPLNPDLQAQSHFGHHAAPSFQTPRNLHDLLSHHRANLGFSGSILRTRQTSGVPSIDPSGLGRVHKWHTRLNIRRPISARQYVPLVCH